jgi:hypothetical protein
MVTHVAVMNKVLCFEVGMKMETEHIVYQGLLLKLYHYLGKMETETANMEMIMVSTVLAIYHFCMEHTCRPFFAYIYPTLPYSCAILTYQFTCVFNLYG